MTITHLPEEGWESLVTQLRPTAHALGWSDLVIKRKFKSRKNEVYLLENFVTEAEYRVRLPLEEVGVSRLDEIVVKRYSSKERLEKEISLLRMLHCTGLTVPEVILIQENLVFLTYVKGTLLLDYLEDCEKNLFPVQEMLEVIVKLTSWLINFYQFTKKHYGEAYSYGDLNARNFILTQEDIWGIDLEDASPLQSPEYDLAGLCANLLTYDPPFTPWKVALTRMLYDQFVAMIPLDLERFQEIWEPLLNSLSERRKVQIPHAFQL